MLFYFEFELGIEIFICSIHKMSKKLITWFYCRKLRFLDFDKTKFHVNARRKATENPNSNRNPKKLTWLIPKCRPPQNRMVIINSTTMWSSPECQESFLKVKTSKSSKRISSMASTWWQTTKEDGLPVIIIITKQIPAGSLLNHYFFIGIHGLPARTGKLKTLDHFDATFFGVHAKQAHAMDPQLRLLLELTYEAIVDAGYNPNKMRGSNTGVFVGASTSETEEFWGLDPETLNGYALTGCCRAMFPNRISYTFDFKGDFY